MRFWWSNLLRQKRKSVLTFLHLISIPTNFYINTTRCWYNWTENTKI